VNAEQKMRDAKGAAKYIGRYLARPAIAEYRIVDYDGKTVQFWCEDHQTRKRVDETLPVYKFLLNLIQHISPKHFRMVGRFGLYSRRSYKKANQVLSLYAFMSYLDDMVIAETDSSNNVIAEYSWDAKGNPLTMTKGGKTYYYHINGHGDVTALTDENGNVVAEYQYDVWGNIVSQSVLTEMNPAKKLEYDAVVANPPFSYRWEPNDTLAEDFRFKSYGLAPKSAADFAFLLHGFHFLSDEGTMAIILPHGVLFRGGAEEKIRTKLLKDGNIDTIIGLPANLFFSTGIPVCILVLKKCKKYDDVLFINASEYYDRGKRQNVLLPEHIDKIVDTYQYRKEDDKKYSRRVSMKEIEKNNFNLNISRYVSTAAEEEIIDLADVKKNLDKIEVAISKAKDKHNQFLKELGLPELS
jgi:hypothetical protein